MSLEPKERTKILQAKWKMSRAQREHEFRMGVLKLFQDSPEAIAWCVLIGGTAFTALLAQITAWTAGESASPPPGINPDGSIDWSKLLTNALGRGILGPASLVLIPADADVSNWSNLTGTLMMSGITGVAAAYLMLSAMSGGARENGTSKGALGGLMGAMGGLSP